MDYRNSSNFFLFKYFFDLLIILSIFFSFVGDFSVTGCFSYWQHSIFNSFKSLIRILCVCCKVLITSITSLNWLLFLHRIFIMLQDRSSFFFIHYWCGCLSLLASHLLWPINHVMTLANSPMESPKMLVVFLEFKS